jgi:hypothetical protein
MYTSLLGRLRLPGDVLQQRSDVLQWGMLRRDFVLPGGNMLRCRAVLLRQRELLQHNL